MGGAVAMPTVLAAAVGGFALGYARGHQDALGVVWNLRGQAQCLDPSLPPEGDPSDDRIEPYPPSQWVWKTGPDAGRPVERWEHGAVNPFEGVPLLGALGDRLAGRLRVEIANWRPPSR